MDINILRVTGMTCAGCSARIEKAVGKIDGVKTCSVNLPMERLTVEFDPEKTSLDAVKNIIKKTGYGWAEIKNNNDNIDIR